MPAFQTPVIPTHAGIQFVGLISLKISQVNALDSRVRGNDGCFQYNHNF